MHLTKYILASSEKQGKIRSALFYGIWAITSEFKMFHFKIALVFRKAKTTPKE